ncbi:hypothetical protein LRAMOSA06350 [Lichtheimia ramosa]|uniref:Uncharacterized protein n=1 Tax=Lichtheimia ramosa TaxID=688394 RepID=A0A077X3M5_9FUNG|nr:hypothetical protein LRAMOSA06350 [Lichtheimia ramosa]
MYLSILVTASRVFVKLPDGFSPLERMVLQTTGNLQRLLSAYFNIPSRVTIIKNELVPCEAGSSGSDNDEDTCQHSGINDLKSNLDMRFERRILMHFGDKFAYDADSIVTVNDQKTLGLLTNHEFGLGQVFSHLRHTPKFALHAIGRHGTEHGSSFWRDYTLQAPGVVNCFIRETFVEGLFEPFTGESSNQGTIWYSPECCCDASTTHRPKAQHTLI